MCLSFTNSTKFGYCTFIVNLEISFYVASTFILLFQHYVCCTRSFAFSYMFFKISFLTNKTFCWILIRIAKILINQEIALIP